MSSDWMNNCDDDFDDEPMTRKRAKKIIEVRKTKYGGYVYDTSDYKAAVSYLGGGSKRSSRRRGLP